MADARTTSKRTRVVTRGLANDEVIRIVGPDGTMNLYRGGTTIHGKGYCRYFIGADIGYYPGNAALRALARAILREVPAPRRKAKR